MKKGISKLWFKRQDAKLHMRPMIRMALLAQIKRELNVLAKHQEIRLEAFVAVVLEARAQVSGQRHPDLSETQEQVLEVVRVDRITAQTLETGPKALDSQTH